MEPAFIPLNDARDRVGTIIDVVGVVRKFTSRTKRAGGIFPPSFPASLPNSQSGYTCTLRVSDPSCRSGVIAQFYCELQRELTEVPVTWRDCGAVVYAGVPGRVRDLLARNTERFEPSLPAAGGEVGAAVVVE